MVVYNIIVGTGMSIRSDVTRPRGRTRIFIGGVGRSGTSILKRVIGKHPRIAICEGELRLHLAPGGLIDLIDDLSTDWSRTRGNAAIWAFKDLCQQKTRSRLRRRFHAIELGHRVLRKWLINKLCKYPGTGYHLDRCFGSDFVREYERFINKLIVTYHSGTHPDVPSKIGFYETQALGKDEIATLCGEFIDSLYSLLLHNSDWCDDTPLNLFHISELNRMFNQGETKFVHMVRNPTDALASFIGLNRPWTSERFDVGLSRLSALVEKLNAEIDYAHADIYTMRLEDLTAEPRTQLRRLFKFFDIEFKEDVLGVDLSRHHTGRSMNELTPDQRTAIWESVGYFYEQFGYYLKNNQVLAQ